MSRGNTWTNADGLVVGFASRDTHNIEDAVVHTLGRTKQAEVRIDHSTVAALAAGTAPGAKAFEIPAGAAVKSATLVVLEGFDALTSLTIGTKGSDGVEESATNLVGATLLAAVNTPGQTVEGAGALIDGPVTDEALYVELVVTGAAPTTGEAVLHIEYIEPVPSSTPPSVIVGEI